jgi:hypothetical protein
MKNIGGGLWSAYNVSINLLKQNEFIVLICGDKNTYYIIPQSDMINFMKYAATNNRFPNEVHFHVDVSRHVIKHRGGIEIDIREFYSKIDLLVDKKQVGKNIY